MSTNARIICLLTDAFGGRGGIAEFNCHLLGALCSSPLVDEVLALPRLVVDAPGGLPRKLQYRTSAATSKAAYVAAVAKLVADPRERAACVICGHIYLLPLAWLLAKAKRAPLVLIIHGIEAWRSWYRSARVFTARVDRVVAVSEYTRKRFLQWSGAPATNCVVIPNCVDLERFRPGPKSVELLERYGLVERRVIFTLSRLSSNERYKGHDQLIELMPSLAEEFPDLVYLIAGDGDDRPRLEAKARELGLGDRVIFAGYVPEREKVAYYRAVDALVMVGTGEGFGITYLEAMACGVPVVASSADASREAVKSGELGLIVDPRDQGALHAAIRQCLRLREPRVPDGIQYFAKERFDERWRAFVQHLLARCN